jgi:leader peptidase (prepilin peptidase)/N-methyltransferase
VSLLVIGAMVDVRHRILPDEVTIYAAPLGIAGAWLLGWLGYDGWLSITWQQAAVGACVWPLIFWFGAFLGRVWSGMEVLGYGDVKLVGVFGAFLGPVGAFVAIMTGSIIGSIIGIIALLLTRRRDALPFGPPLALGALWVVFFGESFVALMFPQWGL